MKKQNKSGAKKENGIKINCAHDELVPVSDLRPNPKNPNKHPEAQINALAKLIEHLGWRAPVTVSNRSGLVVRGHGRLMAAERLGLETVPVDFQDYASEADEWTDLLADNKIPEFAETDVNLLKELFLDLNGIGADLTLTSYDLSEIDKILGTIPHEDIPPKIDQADELNKKWKVKKGDLWLIGDHRLLCGDSTNREDVKRIMQGEKAQLCFTDPPYGVGYDGGTTVRKKLAGDDTTELYGPCCLIAASVTDDAAPLYLWHAGIKGIAAAAAAAAAGYEIRCEIVWNKNIAQFGALSAQYKQKHEPCYYCFKRGKVARWFGPTNEVTVWDVDRSSVNEYHPTQKPIEVAARALRNSSKRLDVVWDGFLGSGTTMAAAHGLKRKCYGIELSASYCAVILQRMKDNFDGIKIRRAKK